MGPAPQSAPIKSLETPCPHLLVIAAAATATPITSPLIMVTSVSSVGATTGLASTEVALGVHLKMETFRVVLFTSAHPTAITTV